ncbi:MULTISPECIES: helix-turn-helix transcriptional regulator [unclassified Sphingobium]|uniref:helix-turn-helix transcriptional regulator n=1 Tax=unclassified Sphingobium TaxID=2611147 RepID=UPI0035A6FD1E
MQNLIRLPEVIRRTGKSRSRIYEDMARGEFPLPVKIGVRAIAWPVHDIDMWIASRIAAREAA